MLPYKGKGGGRGRCSGVSGPGGGSSRSSQVRRGLRRWGCRSLGPGGRRPPRRQASRAGWSGTGSRGLMPHPGRQWAERGGKHKDPDREPRRRRRATYNRYGGVRHLFAALDLTHDRLYGHIKPIKRRTQFSGVLPLPANALPARSPYRDRLRQLLTAPDHEEVPAGRHLGGQRTTSRSPTPRRTPPGSTGSRRSSPPCATSPSTAPTTPTTRSRAA